MSSRKCVLFFFGTHVLIYSSVLLADNFRNLRPYELQEEDRKLNIVYKKFLNRLDSTEQDELRKAQRAWIIFRDLDCKWAYSEVPYDCLIDRARNRKNELFSTYFSTEYGRYMSIKYETKN